MSVYVVLLSLLSCRRNQDPLAMIVEIRTCYALRADRKCGERCTRGWAGTVTMRVRAVPVPVPQRNGVRKIMWYCGLGCGAIELTS